MQSTLATYAYHCQVHRYGTGGRHWQLPLLGYASATIGVIQEDFLSGCMAVACILILPCTPVLDRMCSATTLLMPGCHLTESTPLHYIAGGQK